MARAKPTPAQIRDRKAKRLAIGLSVVLLGIVGFEGPTLLKLVNGSSPTTTTAASATTTAGTTTTAGETATASGATTVAAPAPLVAAGPPGHLSGLALFGTKDPFHAQVGLVTPGATAPAATTTAAKGAKAPANTTTSSSSGSSKQPALPSDAGAATASATTTTTTTPGAAIPIGGTTTTTSSVPFTVTTTATTTTPEAPPNAALISIDGKKQVIFVGESFPSKQPLFKLVKLGRSHGTVRIAVVGGSFTSGIPALLLETKKRLTLANESDGTHYAIELLKLTNAVPPPSTGSGSSAGTTTPALPVTPAG
jgi:hypothetical protein